jgi:uncharacterized membrane protein
MEKMTGVQQDMVMIEEALKEKEKEPSGDMDDLMFKAVVAAIIIGALVTAYFVFAVKEPYSALYIKPDSYANYVVNDSISFIYGVRCFEGEDTTYTAEIYLNNVSIGENTFTLEPGKIKEWQVSTDIPDYMQFPVKVRVELASPGNTYETHYWLKGSKK